MNPCCACIFSEKTGFQRDGGRCIFWSPPAAGFYTHPLFIRPPPLEGYFQGWGGGGVKFGPACMHVQLRQTISTEAFTYLVRSHHGPKVWAQLMVLGLWKREAATGPESRNDLSDPKETKMRLFLFLQRDSKVTKMRHFDPQKSFLSRFGGQKVSFWLLLSLFCRKRKKEGKTSF